MGNRAKVVKQIVTDGRLVDITDRDLLILELLAAGSTNKEISSKLNISLQTLKIYHMPNLYKTLDANCRANVVAIAFRKGLIS